MYTVIFGWLTFIGVLLSTALFIQNIVNPNQSKSRVTIHCTLGKLTIVTLTGHLLSQPIAGWSVNFSIWVGVGLYLIIIASGIILLYLPDTGVLRYHARSVHPALVVGLAFSLLHHILTIYGVI